MLSRLVLDAGGLSTSTLADLADRPGSLRVLDPDADRVRRLREASVAAERADVTDPATIAERGPADVVLVAGRRTADNLAAATAASEAFPAAYLVVLEGRDGDSALLRPVADRVVGIGTAVLDGFASAIDGSTLERVRGLRRAFAGVSGRLGVFTHDNPDPDAIASATALVALADRVGVDAEAAYFGEISHQQNRAMVNLLDLSLVGYDPDDALPYDAFALVDHGSPGVNDQLPSDVDVRIVIDHHPDTEPPDDVPFVDRRSDVGATSTLLADYLAGFGHEPTPAHATALIYGIRVDTDEFRRGVTPRDFEVAAELLPRTDREAIARLEQPSIPGETLEIIAHAIQTREVRSGVLVASVGVIADRDALSQAADRLLALEDVTVTVVSGLVDETVYLSARSRGRDVDLGSVLREAFGDLGSAGGHADMAGAQLPLGVFDSVDTEDGDLAALVDEVVSTRVFDALPAE